VRRQYLPNAEVAETGSVCVFGRTPLTSQSRPLIPEYTWRGFTAVAGSGVGMATGMLDFREAPEDAAARIAPDVTLTAVPGYFMWALTAPARRFAGGAGPDRRHEAVLRTIRRWHRDTRRLVELAVVEETALVTIRTAVPAGPWPASRVTLLGDAIHATSPAGGSGANAALRDAALLAGRLGLAARGHLPVSQAIAEYEREMTSAAWG
jgi:2-polyprenyl-6-methoxyphenol hydroxylase-like FAD-dependent oxidoreductase